MAFLDKIFRWGKKPFKDVGKEQKAKSVEHMADSMEQRAKDHKPSDLNPTPQDSGAYAHVLLRPHTSEKAVASGALNQYIFEVAPRASKPEVALAIKDLYGIAPIAVNIVKADGKQVRFGRSLGKTKEWKKAIVTLSAGKTIDVYKK